MRKYCTIALSLLVLWMVNFTCYANAVNQIQHLYLGAFTQYGFNQAKYQLHYDPNKVNPGHDVDAHSRKSRTLSGGVTFGGDYVLNRNWLIGFTSSVFLPEKWKNSKNKVKTSLNLDFRASLSGVLGLFIKKNWLVYGSIGMWFAPTTFDFQYLDAFNSKTGNIPLSNKKDEILYGPQFSIGLRYFLKKNIFISLEDQYYFSNQSFYTKINNSRFSMLNPVGEQKLSSLSSNTIQLGINVLI